MQKLYLSKLRIWTPKSDISLDELGWGVVVEWVNVPNTSPVMRSLHAGSCHLVAILKSRAFWDSPVVASMRLGILRRVHA